MANRRWHQLEELLELAIAVPSDQRRALLAGQAGSDLVEEVLELAEQHDAASREQFVDPPTLLEPEETSLRSIGPYRIESLLGRGGMSTVYSAVQPKPRRSVAVKVLRDCDASAEVQRRFDDEVAMLARLHHRGIARVHHAGVADTEMGPRHYFAMELVNGEPLTEYVRRRRLGPRKIAALFVRICDAVHHAHQRAIIHRDLKPANILVTAAGQPKILDFGVAKATDLGHEYTEHGRVLGTLRYMSPEQASGDSAGVDVRSDVYSLGMILYECLTGHLPYSLTGKTFTEAVRCISHAPIPRLTGRSFEADLDVLVESALAKEKDDRYSSAAEFAADLRRYLEHRPLEGRPARALDIALKFTRRNRVWVAVSLLVISTLVGGIVSTVLALEREKTARVVIENQALQLKERSDDLQSSRLRAVENALEAQEQSREARRWWQDFERLADLHRLRELEREKDELWPIHPDQIVPIRVWLERAGELRLRLPLHQGALERLRAQATPVIPAEAEASRQERQLHLEALAVGRGQIESELAAEKRGEARPHRLQQLEDRLRELDEETQLLRATRPTSRWEFSDPAGTWMVEQMGRLVDGLRTLVERDVAAMTDRLDRCERVAAESVERFASRWDEASTSIELGDHYGGLELRPQIGLVPLGVDPQSGLWEFWHVLSGDEPPWSSERGATLAASSGIVLVLIPGGHLPSTDVTLIRRGTEGDGPVLLEDSDAVPLEPFFVSKFELTQGQWVRLTGTNPSLFPNGFLHPVESISWKESRATLRTVGLTLPTECQWEYAARAGTTGPWWTGEDVEDVARAGNVADLDFADSYPGRSGMPWRDGYATHAPVGRFAANAFGLHDIIGNLWEFCSDWHLAYENSVVEEGTGRRMISGTVVRGARNRVIRGGCFFHPANRSTSHERSSANPVSRYYTFGLRPARTLHRDRR